MKCGLSNTFEVLTMDSHSPYFTHLPAIIEAILDALLIVSADGRIVLVNQRAETLFGYQRTELLGKFVEHLMPARFRHHHIGYRDGYFSDPHIRPMEIGLELFGLKIDGTEFPIEISLSPLKIEEKLLVLASVRDISVRKKIEDENSTLSALVQFSDDAIIGKDLNGTILSWNKGAEQLYGYSAAEMIGQNITMIFLPEQKDEFNYIIRNIRNGESVRYDETLRMHKGGNYVPVSVTISPIKNSQGKIIGASTVARDITAQKNLQEELRHKNDLLEIQNHLVKEATRLKSEFLANMSHELRTPLNGIIGFSQLIHQGMVGPISVEQQEYLGDIIDNSHHLLKLINDILDLSKIEAGKMDYHYEVVDLQETIHEVNNNFQAIALKKNINLKINVEPTLNNITIDSTKLKKIINNYVSNAIKFTSHGGLVTVRLRYETSNTFRLEVEDTGLGIHKKDLNNLFIEFNQLDSSYSKESEGTGLGLALTKHLAEGLGGTVGVNSIFGKGSTFYALLPCSPQQEQKIQDTKQTKDSQLISDIPRILVIESESQARSILTETLIKKGYAIESAATIAEAVQRSYKHQFDAITIDMLLPNMKDWRIFRKLRFLKSNEKVPALVATSITDEKIEFCYKIHDFLLKPVVPSEIFSALKWAGTTAKNNRSVLIVDKDQDAMNQLTQIIQKLNYHVICENNVKSALKRVKKEHPDVIVLDPIVFGTEGYSFLHMLRKSEIGQYTPIIILTRRDLTDNEHNQLQSVTQRVVLQGTEPIENLFDELQSTTSVLDSKLEKNKELDVDEKR
jgi:PAS domain S-box-containing protein